MLTRNVRVYPLTLVMLAGVMLADRSAFAQSQLAWARIVANPGGRLDWSSVKNLIVYDKTGSDGYYDVYTMAKDGSGSQCLTCGKPIPQLNNGNPAWDPTGSYIVFQSQDPSLAFLPVEKQAIATRMTSPGWGTNNNLWLMTSDGSQFWQLTNVASGMGTLHACFSHGGTKLLWSEKTGLVGLAEQWTIKLADLVWINGVPQLQNITLIQPLGINIFYETHDFSPDDRKILLSAGFENGDPSASALDIYVYDLSAGTLQDLTNTPTEYDEHAHFTPDGSKIVWASSRNITLTRSYFVPFLDYWIMNADGSNQQRVTYFNDPTAPEYYANGLLTTDFSFGPTSQWMFSRLEVTVTDLPQYNNVAEVIAVAKLKTAP